MPLDDGIAISVVIGTGEVKLSEVKDQVKSKHRGGIEKFNC